jgi:hypothetical protein
MTKTNDTLPLVISFTKDVQPIIYRDAVEQRVDIDTNADGVLLFEDSLWQRFKAALDILLFGMYEARVIHSNDVSVEIAQEFNDTLIDKLYHPDGVFVGDMHSYAWFDEDEEEPDLGERPH